MPVKPRQPAPALEVQLIDGSTWRLKDVKPKNFEMIVFYRGLHCPICKSYLSDLEAKLPEFAKRGVDVIAVSTDTRERAGKAKAEWNLTNLRVGCELRVRCMISTLLGMNPMRLRAASNCSFSSGACSGGSGVRREASCRARMGCWQAPPVSALGCFTTQANCKIPRERKEGVRRYPHRIFSFCLTRRSDGHAYPLLHSPTQ